MGTWISFHFIVDLIDHPPAAGEAILEQVTAWEQAGGYLEEHKLKTHHLWCSYAGEAGWSSRDDLIEFLTALAAEHQATISLHFRSDGEDAETLYFGPESAEMILKEAIEFDLRDVLHTISQHHSALTPDLICTLTRQTEELLELAGVVVNSRRLKNLRLLLSRDRKAAGRALDDLIAELEQAEAPPEAAPRSATNQL